VNSGIDIKFSVFKPLSESTRRKEINSTVLTESGEDAFIWQLSTSTVIKATSDTPESQTSPFRRNVSPSLLLLLLQRPVLNGHKCLLPHPPPDFLGHS
jgi:hypothetical protein